MERDRTEIEWIAVGWIVAEKKTPQHTRRPALQINLQGTKVSYTLGVMDDEDSFQSYRHISHAFTKTYGMLLDKASRKADEVLMSRPTNLEGDLRAVFSAQARSVSATAKSRVADDRKPGSE